jgi:hypothetical protein
MKMVTETDIERLYLKYSKTKLTRARAIKLYCKELCCAGDLKSWKNCSFFKCFLYNFRTGKITHDKPNSFKKQRKIAINSTQNVKSHGVIG